MSTAFEFQYPWVLGLLALLPIYAVLRGRIGRASALRFPSVDLARKVGRPARSAAGRLRLFLQLLAAALLTFSPLTLDHKWLVQNLDRIHIGSVQDLGTGIGDATASAVKRLAGIKNSKSRIIILLTDGDNNIGELDPVPAADLAAALG